MSIQAMMRVDPSDRDLDWLLSSLQHAVELELATLPPYLTALWSIPDRTSAAAESIMQIVSEEMLHMVNAGNMLTTIGGTVRLTAPTYPGPLPGHVIPGLEVPLTKLTKAGLHDVFMAIEHPECCPVKHINGVDYPSIGSFYDAIRDCFASVQPPLSGDHQLSFTVGGDRFGPLDTLDKVDAAILEIQEQGEGTSKSPFTDQEFGDELSHYYRFAEIFYGRRLTLVEGQWAYQGAEIPFPDVYDMAPVPRGGYRSGPPELAQFDRAYSLMLDNLDAAWKADDGAALLGTAIGSMFELRALAQTLMQIPLPLGGGYYGPQWRRLPVGPDPELSARWVPSFARDVAPLFTADDLLQLRPYGIRIDDYGHMADPSAGQPERSCGHFGDHANARTAHAYLTGGFEPPTSVARCVWTDQELAVFEAWMDTGFQP